MDEMKLITIDDKKTPDYDEDGVDYLDAIVEQVLEEEEMKK